MGFSICHFKSSFKKPKIQKYAVLRMKLTLFCFIGVITAQRKRDRENSGKNRENSLLNNGDAKDELFTNLNDFYGDANRDSGAFGDYGDFSIFTTTTVEPGFDYSDILANYSDFYGGLTDGSFDFFGAGTTILPSASASTTTSNQSTSSTTTSTATSTTTTSTTTPSTTTSTTTTSTTT